MRIRSALLAVLALAPAALAHTTFPAFYVNGQPQGDGVAMRMSTKKGTANHPISRLDSDDMACNVGGTKGVSRVQSVPDGALLTFEMRGTARNPSSISMARSHIGPCAVYLKKVTSAVHDTAAGHGWFKVFDHGYNNSTQRWCTTDIIDNNGKLSVNLPKGLQGGYYLARPEVLALHNAFSGDPQFYTGCAQIFIEGSGDLVPQATVSIPGYVDYGQPATSFNIYTNDASKYTTPGPSVAELVASGVSSQSPQTEGMKPEGCLVENGNWCGKEVPSYSSRDGCWAATKNCWSQGEECYDSAPPTGEAGCVLWKTKCKGIQDQCSAGNFNGPPNKGTVLTPKKTAIDVGMVMATVSDSTAGSDSLKPTTAKEATTETPAKAPNTSKVNKDMDEDAEYTTQPAKPTKTSLAQVAAPMPTTQASYEGKSKPDKVEDKTNKSSAPSAPAMSLVDNTRTHDVTPSISITAAPAPTKVPQSCPNGWSRSTETLVVTETVYVTAAEGWYKKTKSFRHSRTAHY